MAQYCVQVNADAGRAFRQRQRKLRYRIPQAESVQVGVWPEPAVGHDNPVTVLRRIADNRHRRPGAQQVNLPQIRRAGLYLGPFGQIILAVSPGLVGWRQNLNDGDHRHTVRPQRLQIPLPDQFRGRQGYGNGGISRLRLRRGNLPP